MIMKTKYLTLFFFIMCAFAACKKSDTVSPTATDTASVSSSLVSTTWIVTYLFKDGADKTINFRDYRFTFNKDGLLTGANTLYSDNGSWSLISESNKTKLIMNFPSASRFQDISQDWEVTSKTADKIVMQHISGGSLQPEYLTIERG